MLGEVSGGSWEERGEAEVQFRPGYGDYKEEVGGFEGYGGA